ncbi:glycosyltransferase family 2 protein [Natronococcus jeotgali]|uniref:Family 2 glycosyl transferase n=1 Tax=Natronococcus jeotgali DSM 18795 TaxID=1227498 RepID=L9X715_9EURY|nr:glycosyltransferase family 2 protein [Natronococcus jeotgali]ELY56408.1 family 2 glycosyl transferase [Natronococcus jeotgali DSM 18795]
MYRDHTVGVVIPAYNEEGLIGSVIREMPGYVDRMFVVDDCSSDGTWEEVLEAAREDGGVSEAFVDASGQSLEYAQEVRTDDDDIQTDGGGALAERASVHDFVGRVLPIEHRENLGAGGAIKTGYLAANDDGVDITVTVDGDGQMDLSQMPRLLDPIVEDEADYAKANRLLSREYREEMPSFRLFGNAMLTVLTKVSSGYWKTMDPQNGYTAISSDALEAVELDRLYEYYGYCNDLLVKLNVRGMRVADVAMPAKYGEEESSIEYTTFIRKVSGMLLRNFLWRLTSKYLVTDFHPLALLYFFGAGLSGIGVLAGLWTLYAAIIQGTSLFANGVASLALFSIGVFFLLLAMIYDMQESEDRELQIV